MAQPSQCSEMSAVIIPGVLKGDGCPYLRLLQITWLRVPIALGHHTDDCVGLAVQPDGISYYLRVAAEAPLPEPVAQHCDSVVAKHAVLRSEPAFQ